MAKNTLRWTHAGPAREVGIEVPPVSIGNCSYGLAFDEKQGKTIYVREMDYGSGEVWSFDGDKTWQRVPGKKVSLDGDERHSYFDPIRGAVVVWGTTFNDDDDDYRQIPEAAVIDAHGVRKLKLKGEAPRLEPADGSDVENDVGYALAFDRDRGIAVCFSRRGVWELDADDTWQARSNGEGMIKQEWSNNAGGAYDAIHKRCVFFLQEGEDYKHEFFSWDGETLAKLPRKGLPNLNDDSFESVLMLVSHPKLGVVAHVGSRGMFALGKDAWKKLPEAKNPPPLMTGRFADCRPHMTYDSQRDLFIVGPGMHEGDPGGGDPQRVFFVLRDGAWERQGEVLRPSELEGINGRIYHSVIDSTWYATGANSLRTMVWSDEGWRELVDENACAALLKSGGFIGATTSTPAGLVAVSTHGSVFLLENKGRRASWKQLAGPSPLFKMRNGFVLVHDPSLNRLVLWGGATGSRRVNTTLLFDGTRWTGAKTSPKPKDFDSNNHLEFAAAFDTTLSRVVRFGPTEVAVLEGEVWQTLKPKGYQDLVGHRIWEHLPVHDPITGETLIVNMSGIVSRFDLDRCTELARIEFPKEAQEAELVSAPLYFAANSVFSPETRSIESQFKDDQLARNSLDLSRVFEAAKKLGPRKLLDVPATKKASSARAT
jgi:hypothetical protein